MPTLTRQQILTALPAAVEPLFYVRTRRQKGSATVLNCADEQFY